MAMNGVERFKDCSDVPIVTHHQIYDTLERSVLASHVLQESGVRQPCQPQEDGLYMKRPVQSPAIKVQKETPLPHVTTAVALCCAIQVSIVRTSEDPDVTKSHMNTLCTPQDRKDKQRLQTIAEGHKVMARSCQVRCIKRGHS